jgi:DNA-binding GntR family transcriptional regulator
MSSELDSRANRTLTDHVYELLLDDLITWRLKPGDIVAEGRLAESFGTSRTPVRESLRTLTEEGFLKVIPRTGYIVVPVTAADVHEVSYMRLVLEPEAAGLAVGALSPEEAEELATRTRALPLSLEDNVVLSPRQVYDYNTYFHLSIARASGNRRLAAAIERLLKEEARVMYHDRTVKDPDHVVEEHLALLDTIRSGEPEVARAAMRQHVEGHRDRLFASLTSREEPALIGIDPVS